MKMTKVELFLIKSLPATEKLLNHIVAEYGGYTLTDAEGAWQDEDGGVVYDEVQVCTIYTPVCVEDMQYLMNELMLDYRSDADQKAVMFVLDGNDVQYITL